MMSTIRGKKLVIDLIRHANQDLIEAEGLLADLGMQLNPAGIYMLGAVRTMVKRLEKANTPERMSPERVKVKAIGTWPGYTGIEVPEGAVYVGREMYGHPGSPFANPYKPSAETREAYAECVGLYRTWLLS
jgi:hypothetical protein